MEHTKLSTRSRFGSYREIEVTMPRKTEAIEERQEPDNTGLELKPGAVATYLGIVAVILVLANIAVLSADHFTGYNSVVIHKLVKLFSLDLEVNVPTYFSVLLLFSASLLLGIVTALTRKKKQSYVLEWGILTGGFLFMGFDEMASVHERLIEPTRALLGIDSPGLLYFAWVVPAFVLVAFCGIGFVRFLINLPARTRWAFMTAGAMYLGGAMGLELFEGIYEKGGLIYDALVVLEESLEMGGIIVLIWALLTYIPTYLGAPAPGYDFSEGFGNHGRKGAVTDLGLQS